MKNRDHHRNISRDRSYDRDFDRKKDRLRKRDENGDDVKNYRNEVKFGSRWSSETKESHPRNESSENVTSKNSRDVKKLHSNCEEISPLYDDIKILKAPVESEKASENKQVAENKSVVENKLFEEKQNTNEGSLKQLSIIASNDGCTTPLRDELQTTNENKCILQNKNNEVSDQQESDTKSNSINNDSLKPSDKAGDKNTKIVLEDNIEQNNENKPLQPVEATRNFVTILFEDTNIKTIHAQHQQENSSVKPENASSLQDNFNRSSCNTSNIDHDMGSNDNNVNVNKKNNNPNQ